ncbi:hypothetical protein A3F07_01615 [candidate division WWE3 bacterium RIFCSPHIGHO2_12_FULL_38_15]|uniref:PsbP C-terminal domain-containing protein n=1 Tax=candidate division WWE3 bacterium RIFCSPHIGHO2_02_FULL_38_14 TaxID=1802620 RepID=A0A1F4V8U4_UNCKA|nr:MAG: hypothetical protein A2793_01685 [candidate division WWE3 bacterium RIFCSPHIGHO2_01_FULL_38_45]OGC48403.1 MAG: hypothetical protein A3F07_01615 [candidate division WWE3 bacterium RIFCSPHIGHO2_12_FULL_38_15]OGC53622.1 MAG: hypothetical protein A3D91_04240 [candidate division WWE3 bacterium RIFCSPHIGHO2_02_FULL_38_14]OGC54336.1 MAG: hypothetical protein A3B64_02410 [candidate division WWE3 bacterium RIFCSPLOWO2_01_FULL_37_24]HLB51581.1 hypothetical protein [Patescibacteria group bacterium
MNKFLLAVLLLIAISYGAWYLNKSVHIDINHKFILTNFSAWEEVPRKSGAYKSFATHKDGIINSYADIRFLKKEKTLSETTHIKSAKEECQNLANEPQVTSYTIDVSEFKKDNSVVVMCRGEGIGTVTKLPTTVTMYSFFGLEDEILILSTSYPSNNTTEEINENNLIDGFRFY